MIQKWQIFEYSELCAHLIYETYEFKLSFFNGNAMIKCDDDDDVDK